MAEITWTAEAQRWLEDIFEYIAADNPHAAAQTVNGIYAHDLFQKGDHNRDIESARRALAIAEELKDFALQVVANFFLGQAYRAQGDYRRAMDFFRWNIESLEGERVYERVGLAGLPSVLSRTWLVWCYAELGELAEGITHGEEGFRVAEAVDHPYSLSVAYLGVGYLHLQKGDFDKAIITLERGLRLCQISDNQVWLHTIAEALGYAYTLSGRAPEGLPLLEQAVEQSTSIGNVTWLSNRLLGRWRSLSVKWLGEGYLLARRIEDAIVHAGRALDLARQYKERGNEAYALRLLGEISAHKDPSDIEEAEHHYRQALALAEELGMRPLLAHCHLGLGILYRRTGKRQQAKEHLNTATAMMREMEMGLWLEEAELKELG